MSRLQRNQKNLSGSVVGTVSPKMVIAAVLLIAMVALWGRVLLRGKSGPAKAAAKSNPVVSGSASGAKSEDTAIAIQPVSLPVLPGRHDRIESDPFMLDSIQWFGAPEQPQPVPSVQTETETAEQKHRASLQRIAQRLVLEAIVKDSNGIPVKACVNGTVLFKGSTIKVKENGEIYELNVAQINATEIKLVWQVFDLTIKMPSTEWHDSWKGGAL